MALGDRIKELRTMRELTQEQVAESCNVSISTVSRWESNRSTPIRKHRVLLAATLQIDENSFFVTPDVMLPENVIVEEVVQAMKRMSLDQQRLLLYMAHGIMEFTGNDSDST